MDFLKKLGQFILNPFGAKKETPKPSQQSSSYRNDRGPRDRDHDRQRSGGSRRGGRGGNRRHSRPGEGNSRGPRHSGGNRQGNRQEPASGREGNREGHREGGRSRNRGRGGSRRFSGRPHDRSRNHGAQRERGINLKDSRNEELTGEKRRTEVPREELVGSVTHFFDQANAAAIRLENAGLAVGDTVAFKGPETAFRMKIESLQIDRVPVPSAPRGSEVGVLVKAKVKEGDRVFRVL